MLEQLVPAQTLTVQGVTGTYENKRISDPTPSFKVSSLLSETIVNLDVALGFFVPDLVVSFATLYPVKLFL